MLDGELVSADRRFACRLRWTLSVWMRPSPHSNAASIQFYTPSIRPATGKLVRNLGRISCHDECIYIYIRKRRYAIPVTPRRNDRRDEKSSPVSPRLFWNDRKIEEKIDTISQTIGKHDSSAIPGIFIVSSSASNPSCVREMKLLLLPMRRCRRRPVNRRDDISIVW